MAEASERVEKVKVTVTHRGKPGQAGRHVFFDAHNVQHDLEPGQSVQVELPRPFADSLQERSKAGHGHLELKGHEAKPAGASDKDLQGQIELTRAKLEELEREQAEKAGKNQAKRDIKDLESEVLSGMTGGSRPQFTPAGVTVGPAGPGPTANVGQDNPDPRHGIAAVGARSSADQPAPAGARGGPERAEARTERAGSKRGRGK